MSNQFSAPVLQRADGTVEELIRIPIGTSGTYAERDLQNHLFNHPSLLPVEEIDTRFMGLIPICTELRLRAGFMDILYATPDGQLVCVETKLWRNPEARREVVGQILDYASELSTWSIENLQNAVFNRTGRRFIDIVADGRVLDEANFLDSISRSLRDGRFLLLICGDGIREGTEAISRFLTKFSGNAFTFGLVELAVFESTSGDRLYQPRVLGKTRIIPWEDKETAEDDTAAIVPPKESRDNTERQIDADRWLAFWQELGEALTFSDANHVTFKPEKRFRAAANWAGKSGYMLLYFDRSANTIGIGISLDAGTGREIFDRLHDEKEAFEDQIEQELIWKIRPNGRSLIGTAIPYLSPWSSDERTIAQEWFARTLVAFDAVFRPRLEELEVEFGSTH